MHEYTDEAPINEPERYPSMGCSGVSSHQIIPELRQSLGLRLSPFNSRPYAPGPKPTDRTPRQVAIGNALGFLHEAAEALDHAEAELKQVGLDRITPCGFSRKVDRKTVFPSTTQPNFWLTQKHNVTVGDLVDTIIALVRTIEEPE